MGISWNKKTKENNKRKAKIDKENRKQERKENNDKGKSLEEMMVYLDQDGNITSVPPHLQERRPEEDNNDIAI